MAAVATASVAVSAATPAAATPTVAATPAPAVPRPDADEDAVVEPSRPVKAVGGAGIGVVRVVAPIANRGTVFIRSGNDRGADSHTHIHLGRCSYCKRQSQKHRYHNQSHTPHKILHVLPRLADPDLGPGVASVLSTIRPMGFSPRRLLIIQTAFPQISCGLFSRIVHGKEKGKIFPRNSRPRVLPGNRPGERLLMKAQQNQQLSGPSGEKKLCSPGLRVGLKSGEFCAGAQVALDAQDLIPLHHALTAREGTYFKLPGVGGHGEM